jgi:tRNA(Ile)-lysidine synthase
MLAGRSQERRKRPEPGAISKALTRHPFTQRVRRALLAHTHRGQRVLLAVSGGPDSTAMAIAVSAFGPYAGLGLGVASIDHGLRPESAAEVVEVARLAARLGLPFHTQQIRVAHGAGVEDRARTLRYRALRTIAETEGYDFIATAHTANDQAETVVFRLARGAALRGQRGVLARRGRIIRPLLDVERGDVEAFLEAAGVSALVDPSNQDPTYTRVRVRSQVVPAIVRSVGKGSVRNMARSASLAAEDEALLEQLSRKLYRRNVKVVPEGLLADGRALAKAEPALVRRALVRIGRELGVRPLGYVHVQRALGKLQSDHPWRLAWPGGVMLVAKDGKVHFSRKKEGGSRLA